MRKKSSENCVKSINCSVGRKQTTATALNTRLTSCGGTALSSANYWSSTEYGKDHAWFFSVSNGAWYFRDGGYENIGSVGWFA